MDNLAPKSVRSRFNISKIALQRPVLTLSFWLAVVVAGVLAFSSLKYALFPDITFPVVVVNASAPLKTAVETEQKLTNPIEATLSGLNQLDGVVESTTYPGQSVVRLKFVVGTNLEEATRTVKSALKTVGLPAKTTTKVIPVNLNEAAVVSYAITSSSEDSVSSSENLKALSKTVKDQIIPAIAKLPGVLKVTLSGEPRKLGLTKPPTLEDLIKSGTLVRFNGQEAIAFQVVKKSDANTLEVVREVNQEVERLRTTLPAVQFSVAATQADYIEAATEETVKALIEAMILSVIVIYPFLWNWKATVISALAIPMSLLGTFIVMAFYGFNLETITLLALALVIGNVVDDAIVDVENIARHLEEGEAPRQAAIAATDEIGLTVTAATLTAIAVFLPVGTMGGALGQFFKPFGITISAAMITSLLVARTLSPLLAASWLKPPKPRDPNHPTIADRFQRGFDWLNQQYRRLLQWALNHKGIVVAIALASFVGGLALIPLIPKGFIPKLDRGEFNISYIAPTPEIPDALKQALSGQVIGQSAIDPRQLPPGSPQLAAAQSRPSLPEFDPLKDSLQVAKQLDRFVQRSPDVESTFTIVGSRQGEPNKGIIYIKLKGDRTANTSDIQDRFRRDLPNIEGVTTSIEDIQFVDTGGDKPVQVQIQGNDLPALDRAAQQIQTRLAKIPGLVDVSTTAQNNSDSDIREIQHTNKQRVATISANLGQGLTIGEAGERATAEAKAVLPPEITLRLGGDSARIDEVLSGFGKTLALSLLCIVVVLFVLFRRWTDTLVIFLSLPLSIVGAMVGLLIARSDFGIISLIGIIFLLGLTSKNAILIVDYINQLRRSGLQRDDAILKAAPVRFRPILMTTVATLLGMLPIAVGWGAGAELRSPMAIAIMGGLITSTLLSLIVIPVLYALLDNFQTWLNKTVRKIRKSAH